MDAILGLEVAEKSINVGLLSCLGTIIAHIKVRVVDEFLGTMRLPNSFIVTYAFWEKSNE